MWGTLIAPVLNAAKGLANAVYTPPAERMQKKNERLEIKTKFRLAQLEARAKINAAQNAANIAAARPGATRTWRDWLGFVLVVAFALTLLFRLFPQAAGFIGATTLTADEFTDIKAMILAMLGALGTLRTIEKSKGVARGQNTPGSAIIPAKATAMALVAKLRGG